MTTNMNGDIPNRTEETDEIPLKNVDFDSIWGRRQSRQNQLLVIYLWVMLMIFIAWFVGYWSCSCCWLLAIFIATLSVWKTKVFRITEEHLMHEQLLVHRKRALRGSETTEWLNFIINRWCLFSSTSLCDIMKRHIDPILTKFKPVLLEDVSIKSLTFGDQAPNIHHIQVFETSDGLPGGRKQASWLNVGKPPKELNKLDKYHIVFDMEAGLHCEQFKMVLATKVVGMSGGPDILVENLKVEGRLHARVTFSTDVPFPHMSRLMLSFDEKPNIWFSVKVLRSLELMEIPLLKSWIHNLVLDAVCLSFVDPYKFDLDLTKLQKIGPVQKSPGPPAVGVLSVFVGADGYQTDSTESTYNVDDVTFCTLQLGDTEIHSDETKLGQKWSHGSSFLVTDLNTQKLSLLMEQKQMLTSVIVATYDVALASYSLDTEHGVDAVLDKENTGLKTPLNLRLEYTPLTPVLLSQSPPVDISPSIKTTVCGVLYICVHGGYDLLSMDEDGYSDPYCVIFANRKKVATTHYVRQSLNPRWETHTELIVDDFTKTNLRFLVYDWDGVHASDDDFLGAAHLTLTNDDWYVVHKSLSLTYNILNVGQVSEVNLGSIVVSVVFRPVPAVAMMTEEHVLARTSEGESVRLTASKGSTQADVFKLLSQGHGILELTIMCARNLVAMDSNGFSDPYVEVRIGSQKKFVTTVKKKTLNPVWDESVTTQLPDDGEILELSVWDKDPLMMKDFIGSVEFSSEDLKRISSIGEPGWYLLQKTKSGQIKLGIKVLTSDMKVCLEELSVFANKPAPSRETTEEVFENQSEIITAEAASKAERTAEAYGTLPKHRKKKLSGGFLNPLKRSVSDAQVNKTDRFRFFRFKSVDKDDSSVSQGSQKDLSRHASQESASYIDKVRSALDLSTYANYRYSMKRAKSSDLSHTQGQPRLSSQEDESITVEATSAGNVDKFFNVRGTISRYRVDEETVQAVKGQVYCKLRIDSRSDLQRKQKFSPGRVVCKTPVIHVQPGEHPMEFEFEIDRGGGIPRQSLFIVDVKSRSKTAHIATRGYTLQNMFDDNTHFVHWLPMENGIQFLVELNRDASQSSAPRLLRNPLNRISQSFRRPRSASHNNAPPADFRHSAPPDMLQTQHNGGGDNENEIGNESGNDRSINRGKYDLFEREDFLDETMSTARTDMTDSVVGNTMTHDLHLTNDLDPDLGISPVSKQAGISDMEFSTDLNVGRIDLESDLDRSNDLENGHGLSSTVNGHYETSIDDGEATFIRSRPRRQSVSTDV